MKYEYSDAGTPIYTPSMAKRDGARSIAGYRLRKHEALKAKLSKSGASKAKAVSVLVSSSIVALGVQAYA